MMELVIVARPPSMRNPHDVQRLATQVSNDAAQSEPCKTTPRAHKSNRQSEISTSRDDPLPRGASMVRPIWLHLEKSVSLTESCIGMQTVAFNPMSHESKSQSAILICRWPANSAPQWQREKAERAMLMMPSGCLRVSRGGLIGSRRAAEWAANPVSSCAIAKRAVPKGHSK